MRKDFIPYFTITTFSVGPFISSADGLTPVTNAVLDVTNIKISKNDGVFSAPINAITAAHDVNGFYQLTLARDNFDVLGKFIISINVTGCLPVKQVYEVRRQYTINCAVVGDLSFSGEVPTIGNVSGNTLVFEGENFTVVVAADSTITGLTLDGTTIVNNDRYYLESPTSVSTARIALLNVGKSHKIIATGN